jgi:translation initiation factor 1 (eIF-1/SUI1)
MKSEPEPSAAEDPMRDGLKHNPFRALRDQAAPGTGVHPAAHVADHPARESTISGPVRERITVRLERAGRAGKAVTIAEGPGLAGRDRSRLARELARALGVGVRVEQGALVLQGDQGGRLATWLAARGFTAVARGN